MRFRGLKTVVRAGAAVQSSFRRSSTLSQSIPGKLLLVNKKTLTRRKFAGLLAGTMPTSGLICTKANQPRQNSPVFRRRSRVHERISYCKVRISMRLRQWHPWVTSGLLCAAALMAPSTFAHHSFAAYDATQTRTLRGTVKTFQWSNPHSAFTLLVEANGGADPFEWNIVTSSPAVLMRFGWTQDSLKVGDRVSVLFNPLSDGSHGGRLHTVVLLNTGQVLLTKLSAGVQPKIE